MKHATGLLRHAALAEHVPEGTQWANWNTHCARRPSTCTNRMLKNHALTRIVNRQSMQSAAHDT